MSIDEITTIARRELMVRGETEAAAEAHRIVIDAIHDRAGTIKGIRSFEVHHQQEIARVAFLRSISHGREIAEAFDAAAESVKIMISVQAKCPKTEKWGWVISKISEENIYHFESEYADKARPASELDLFRKKWPEIYFRPAHNPVPKG